jgi:hypothetical protein
VTARVSPSQRIRAQIDELIAGAERGSLAEHFEQVACLAVRLVLQTALETELTEFLGRDRYARGERDRDWVEHLTQLRASGRRRWIQVWTTSSRSRPRASHRAPPQGWPAPPRASASHGPPPAGC